MLVYAVHGWGETDKGAGSVGSLAPHFHLKGVAYQVFGHKWPRLHTLALLQQRRRTREEADRLAGMLKDGQGLLTYSNGAPVARHAIVRSGVKIPIWVMIAPAMDEQFELPPSVRRAVVLHSDDDLALLFGELWTWVNPAAWILGHDWGLLGRVGYLGDDPRVENWPARKNKTVRHLGWFDKESVSYWGPKIAQVMRFSDEG